MIDKNKQFIEKARKVHGDKYDYSKVEYINAKTKVCIICPEHGEFWVTPDNFINSKRACRKCGDKKCNCEKLHNNGLKFIEQCKIIGIIIDSALIINELCRIYPEMLKKTRRTLRKWCYRFLKRHKYT